MQTAMPICVFCGLHPSLLISNDNDDTGDEELFDAIEINLTDDSDGEDAGISKPTEVSPVTQPSAPVGTNPLAQTEKPSSQVAVPASIPPKANTRIAIKFGDIDPLFRCNRCDQTAHMRCLIDEHHDLWSGELSEDPTTHNYVFGSEEHYRTAWRCNDCLSWTENVESIITFRDKKLEVNEVPFITSIWPPKPGYKREYFVKRDGVPHRWNVWVSARWIQGLKGGTGKINKFHTTPQLSQSRDPLMHIPEAWLRADKILDVQFKSNRDSSIQEVKATLSRDEIELGIDRIQSVFVKWGDTPYNECSWETIPDKQPWSALDALGNNVDARMRFIIDYEMRPSFIEALKDYWKREKVIEDYKKMAAMKNRNRRFVEHQKQPNYLVNGTLKGYQLDGLNWLVYKWTRNLPCILADEMGLGKTVQIVSFLSVLYHDFKVFPFLVVAPSITIGHWINEFQKWAPDMVIVNYHGSKRDKEFIRCYEIFEDGRSSSKVALGKKIKCHVLLANYETIMAEGGMLKDVQFQVVVCDEGHRLKNDEAKTFKSLSTNIKTKHRVVLTGADQFINHRWSLTYIFEQAPHCKTICGSYST
jgi:hypothetical protein